MPGSSLIGGGHPLKNYKRESTYAVPDGAAGWKVVARCSDPESVAVGCGFDFAAIGAPAGGVGGNTLSATPAPDANGFAPAPAPAPTAPAPGAGGAPSWAIRPAPPAVGGAAGNGTSSGTNLNATTIDYFQSIYYYVDPTDNRQCVCQGRRGSRKVGCWAVCGRLPYPLGPR